MILMAPWKWYQQYRQKRLIRTCLEADAYQPFLSAKHMVGYTEKYHIENFGARVEALAIIRDKVVAAGLDWDIIGIGTAANTGIITNDHLGIVYANMFNALIDGI